MQAKGVLTRATNGEDINRIVYNRKQHTISPVLTSIHQLPHREGKGFAFRSQAAAFGMLRQRADPFL